MGQSAVFFCHSAPLSRNLVKALSSDRVYSRFWRQLSKEVMVSFFDSDHCFGARAPAILVPSPGWRTLSVQIEHSSLILVEEGSVLCGTRRRGKCRCHHASGVKTPLQRDDLLNGSRTGERSTRHGTRSQNARSPEAPATLPEHRVLVVHPALTRWLAQLTARGWR